ncbi:unnamed protein product [Euphydryas editha]|uniref:Uncharacterized protein n=1 Tax=Euphydryas editha TaxID=104508 RepID=A0AAU9UQV5_EUPED|nr:unnamed protein product [Euphydryas editha]
MSSSDSDNEIPKKKECPQNVLEKMSEDDINGLIEKINSFETKNEQDIYLQSRIELFIPKDTSKRTDGPAKAKPKTVSCKDFVKIGMENRKICKSAFLSLYGVRGVMLFLANIALKFMTL